MFRPLLTHKRNAAPKTRSLDIRLTLLGILFLASIPLNGHSAKVISQADLTSLPPGQLAMVYVQDFKIEKESTGNDQQTLGGGRARALIAEVDQGSRVLRSQVGFGAGATDLAVLVNVADLQKGKVEPFYKLEAQAGSRKMPGAAVTRNPYVAAAKFVMSRRDLPKNIRQTAQTVADQIIRRAK